MITAHRPDSHVLQSLPNNLHFTCRHHLYLLKQSSPVLFSSALLILVHFQSTWDEGNAALFTYTKWDLLQICLNIVCQTRLCSILTLFQTCDGDFSLDFFQVCFYHFFWPHIKCVHLKDKCLIIILEVWMIWIHLSFYLTDNIHGVQCGVCWWGGDVWGHWILKLQPKIINCQDSSQKF